MYLSERRNNTISTYKWKVEYTASKKTALFKSIYSGVWHYSATLAMFRLTVASFAESEWGLSIVWVGVIPQRPLKKKNFEPGSTFVELWRDLYRAKALNKLVKYSAYKRQKDKKKLLPWFWISLLIHGCYFMSHKFLTATLMLCFNTGLF